MEDNSEKEIGTGIEKLETLGDLELTRRGFLKASGVSLAYLTLLSLRGCVPRIVDQANRERTAREPEIFVDVFFLRESSSDERKLEKRLAKADVFIPEGFGWNAQALSFYNEISQGEKPIEEIIREMEKIFMFSPTEIEKLRILHGKKKPVFFIDVPREHKLYDEWYKMDRSRLVLNYTIPLKETVKNFRECLREEASFHRQREDFMLDQLRKIIPNLKKDTRFVDKDKLKILLELGASHTRMYHLLKFETQIKESSWAFSEMPFIFTIMEEARRRYWFLEDPKNPKKIQAPTDELIAKIPLEVILIGLFYPEVYPATKDGVQTARALRKIIDQFSYDEIRALFEKSREYHAKHTELQPWDPPPELKDLIIEKLKEKGIQLPRSEKEQADS